MTTELQTPALNPSIVNIPMPAAIARLPVHRGYPVPWFVAWVGDEPEFRAAAAEKFGLACREKRCWVCGTSLFQEKTFVIGPMCAVNRTSAEPPCHHECAVYSAMACPFLSRPQMERREEGLPVGTVDPAGHAIRRNPGVTVLWRSAGFHRFMDGAGGTLFHIGEPLGLDVFSQGRRATRKEITASMESGLPALKKLAKQEGKKALRELRRMYDIAEAALCGAI